MRNFTAVPNALIADPNLTASEFRVLVALMAYDWADANGTRKGVVWPAMATLGERLGLSRRAVLNTLRRLESKGYVSKLSGGGGRMRTNVYALTGGKTVNFSSQFCGETVNFEAQNCEQNFTGNRLKNEDEAVVEAEKLCDSPSDALQGDDSASPNHHAPNGATQAVAPAFGESQNAGLTPEAVCEALVARLGYDRAATLLGAGYIGPTADGRVQVHVPQEVAAAWDSATLTEVCAAIEAAGASWTLDAPAVQDPDVLGQGIPGLPTGAVG